MSYDLMVFNETKAPRDKADFLRWYYEQTEWKEDHDYQNPDITTPELRNWFFDIIKKYPPMNGPFTREDVDEIKWTDYSIGKDIIYAAFAWPEAEEAFKLCFELAKKHKVGFFDVSSDEGKRWIHDEHGNFICIDDKKPWWKFW